jgi:hypothetical protein
MNIHNLLSRLWTFFLFFWCTYFFFTGKGQHTFVLVALKRPLAYFAQIPRDSTNHADSIHSLEMNMAKFGGFCFFPNFMRWVDWRSSERGLSQIWLLQVRETSSFFCSWNPIICWPLSRTYSLNMVVNSSHFFPRNVTNLGDFFPRKCFVKVVGPLCFFGHHVRHFPRKKKWKHLGSNFLPIVFWWILWCSQSGNRSYEDLAKFGYKPNMKVIKI